MLHGFVHPKDPWAEGDTGYLATLDKKAKLPLPHYSDRRFRHPQTVFGKKPKSGFGHDGLHYDYSDRLWEWGYQKMEDAIAFASQAGLPGRSVAFYEHVLSTYFGRQVVIEHVVAGVNRGNGYPYFVFGYRFSDNVA